MHWEEKDPLRYTRETLDALARDYPTVARFAKQSVAFEILRVLDWRSFEDFRRDLASLA